VGENVWKEWDKYLGSIWIGMHIASYLCMYVEYTDVLIEKPEDNAVDEEPGFLRRGTDPSIPWDLPTDEDGSPILLLQLELPLPQLKEILRSFMTITYCMP
jgi:hypothetical protein